MNIILIGVIGEIRMENKALEKRLKRKRRRRNIIIFLLIVGPIAMFIEAMFWRVSDVFDVIFEAVGEDVPNLREEQNLPPLNLGEDPFSILILGLDEGRSDTMMVATVNPELDTTYLLSIARDTKVDIPGHWTTRINHAFAYGGIDLAIKTVQNFLNIPIDYYASLRMEEFPTLVDAFGGVQVYNRTVAFSLGGYHFPLGYINLTGNSAYYYIRMRIDDPRGDFGRQERQRDVLTALVNEIAGVAVVTRYQQILDSVSQYMRTDVTLNEMLTISLSYNRALRNITNLTLQAPGNIINGMYLIPIPEDQRLEMSQRLRGHLELD